MRSVKTGLVRRLFYLFFAWTVGLVLIILLLDVVRSGDEVKAQAAAAGSSQAFLPVISFPPTPAGSYNCVELEFGLGWRTEVITLNNDGSSIYAYGPPDYSDIVTGTWVYTPTIQEVGFTNFQWHTATFLCPNNLWVSHYLPHVNFEIALDCRRRSQNMILPAIPGE